MLLPRHCGRCWRDYARSRTAVGYVLYYTRGDGDIVWLPVCSPCMDIQLSATRRLPATAIESYGLTWEWLYGEE